MSSKLKLSSHQIWSYQVFKIDVIKIKVIKIEVINIEVIEIEVIKINVGEYARNRNKAVRYQVSPKREVFATYPGGLVGGCMNWKYG